MDSTKPASRRTRRCFDTVGCGIPSRRSISPTDCWDETSRLNIARRFGSAMISNTDSILLVYSTEHIRVKVYSGGAGGASKNPIELVSAIGKQALCELFLSWHPPSLQL